MKTKKSAFFIVAGLILIICYVAFFSVRVQFGKYVFTIPGAPNMRFGIDIRGGVDAVFEPEDPDFNPSPEQLAAARETIENRLDMLNILDRDVTVDSDNGYILVRFPWKSSETEFDPEQAIAELGETAKLTFKDPDGNIVVDGSHVTESVAKYSSDTKGNTYFVSLQFDDEGGKAFADATRRLVGQKISIYMDEVLISDPTVNEAITDGKAMITGIGKQEETVKLANKIAAGALPFSLVSRNHSTISATLGAGALDVMVKAGITAFILVCLFLILYYRLPGAVACLALLLQTGGQLLALSIPQMTVTLPGIAAIILSIGMGVDANIIVSERIREELRAGRPLDSAITLGFKNAFSSVFDGNITVMIVAFILMRFGSGSLLSFGYSLLTGVILNFVAGVTASRVMIRSLSTFGGLRDTKLYVNAGRAKA